MKRSILARIAGLAIASVLFLGRAEALPSIGEMRPALALNDAWGRAIRLDTLGAQPVLVVYEDRSSSGENNELKKELAQLARSGNYQGRIALIPVADVTSYDYWPVRGFVVSAIKDESRKIGAPIYCDWDGRFRRTLSLQPGRSNVVLYGKDGRTLLSHAGPMPREVRDALIATLRSALDP